MNDERQGDEAAQAFDNLRQSVEGQNKDITAELTLIRKGVEGLFDQLEGGRGSPDLTNDVARIKSALGEYGEILEKLIKSPALSKGPEAQAQAMGQVGERLVRELSIS